MPHLPAQILWTYYERMGDVKLFVFSVVFELRSCRSVASYYASTENDTAKVCRRSPLIPTTTGRLCENLEVRTRDAEKKLRALLLQQYMDVAVVSTPGEERPTLQVFAETPSSV